MGAEDNFGILWDSLNFWESKCFRNINKCSFEALSPKVLKDISFLFLLYLCCSCGFGAESDFHFVIGHLFHAGMLDFH